MNDCIFCKIVKKEIPSNIIKETESLIAFPDINPSAEIHILIVPKKHLPGMQDLTLEDSELLGQTFQLANQLVREYNLSNTFYKVVANGGKAQHVPHLHFHLLGGKFHPKDGQPLAEKKFV